jgi:hypothetical protein
MSYLTKSTAYLSSFVAGALLASWITYAPASEAYDKGYRDGKESQQKKIEQIEKKQTELEKRVNQLAK